MFPGNISPTTVTRSLNIVRQLMPVCHKYPHTNHKKMGFFSSKKIDSDASFMDTDSKSVVQSIRSRFVSCPVFTNVKIITDRYRQYGKSKGKDRGFISSPVVSSPRSPGTQRSGDKSIPVRVTPQGTSVLRKDRPSTGPSPISNDAKPSPKNPPSPSQSSTDPMTYRFIFSSTYR